MHDDIHQSDIGTVFLVTLVDLDGQPVDLTGATLQEIRFLKPDGVVLIKPATNPSGGVLLGELEYVTVSGDLDITGTWEIRAKITLATGTWTSTKEQFKVNSIF